MENNTTKKDEAPKYTETKLEISLRTGSSHNNPYDEAITRIDYTSYYLGSIFWFARVALEAETMLDIQADSSAYKLVELRANLQYLMQLGEALSEWLPNYSGVFHEIAFKARDEREGKEEDSKTNQSEPQKESNQSHRTCHKAKVDEAVNDGSELKELAAQISNVLKNPLLPKKLYDVMTDELFIVFAEPDSPEQVLASLVELSRGGEDKND